jgi:hypothetical protein
MSIFCDGTKDNQKSFIYIKNFLPQLFGRSDFSTMHHICADYDFINPWNLGDKIKLKANFYA